MHKITTHFFLISLLLFLFGCSSKEEEKKANNTNHNLQEKIVWGKNISIKKLNDYNLITLTNPLKEKQNFVLYKTKKEEFPKGYFPIKTPINSITTSSCEYTKSIEIIDELHKLKAVGNIDYHYSEKVNTLFTENKIDELNKGNFNEEKLLLINPSIHIEMGSSFKKPAFQKINKIFPKIIYNFSYLEDHPLGRAEWIKLYGLLFNKEEIANNFFEKVEQEYLKTKQAIQLNKQKKSVLINAPYAGSWYIPNNNSYMGTLLKDAGFTLIGNKNNTNKILNYSTEEVYSNYKNADIWLNPGIFKSLKEINEKDSRLTLFKSFKNKNVFSNMILSKNNAVDYWELGILRPDLILKDLNNINQNKNLDSLYFFRKLPE